MLRGFRSTQIRTVPSFLGTTTIPAHQGVGTSTLEMTPKDSMRDSSSFTFLQSGSGTFLGVCRAKGVASGLRQIWNSPLSVPRPENRAGNWVVMSPRSSGSCLTSATLAKRLSSSIAGRPNRFCSKSLTT